MKYENVYQRGGHYSEVLLYTQSYVNISVHMDTFWAIDI